MIYLDAEAVQRFGIRNQSEHSREGTSCVLLIMQDSFLVGHGVVIGSACPMAKTACSRVAGIFPVAGVSGVCQFVCDLLTLA